MLFDHNMPLGLAGLLPGHEVSSAASWGWADLANGKLLQAAEDAGFEVMVTADQSMAYQQNLKGRKLGLVVLGTNHWPTLRTEAERVSRAIHATNFGDFFVVDF